MIEKYCVIDYLRNYNIFYNLEQYNIHIRKQLHMIITLCSIDENNPPNIQKPDVSDNIGELIEYQQLVDLYITDRAMELKEHITKRTNEIIEELIKLNTN